MRRLHVELSRRGLAFIVLATDPPYAAMRDFARDSMATLPVYADARGEATMSFGNFGTPTYYVLDGQGVVRFRGRDAGALVRQALVVR